MDLLETGVAIAYFAGVPLLRFETLDALLEKFAIAPDELVELISG